MMDTTTSTSSSSSRHLNLLLPPCLPSRADKQRSVSPLTPVGPPRLSSGVHIFKVLSSRLTRHRARHQSHSPSSDSESSSSSNEEHTTSSGGERRNSRSGNTSNSNNNNNNSSSSSSSNSSSGYRNAGSNCSGADRNSGGDQNSNSGSDSGSGSSGSSSGQTSSNNTSDSGSRLSIKGVFKRLSINGRSQSAGGRKPRPSKKAPKKILRAPVVSSFVKGLSGLPTQRVPRGYPCPCPCPCVFIPHHDTLFALNR